MRNFGRPFRVLQAASFVCQPRVITSQCILGCALYERPRMAIELTRYTGNISSNVMTDNDLLSILTANSTEKYYIEYKGFLSNHLSHGIIALHRLGASRERIERFIDIYSRRLDRPPLTVSRAPSLAEQTPVEGLLGSANLVLQTSRSLHRPTCIREPVDNRTDWKRISETQQRLVRLRFSRAHSSRGLAYLHHSHLPLRTSAGLLATPLGSGTTDIVDVVRTVAADGPLREFVEERTESDLWKTRLAGNFQRRVGVLMTERGDDLLRYTLAVRLPAFFRADDADGDRAEKIGRWLVDRAVILYAASDRRNDFFLLHGVTATWSLAQLLPLLTIHGAVDTVVRVMLCALFAVYVAQVGVVSQTDGVCGLYYLRGCPPINQDVLESTDRSDSTWPTTIARAIAVECDEHVYKLVQVCHDLHVANSDTSMRPVYRLAAAIAVDHPLLFN
ncbi:hypothetical protein NP493_227g03073 [Ridgeia piscesae]|uniref:Uncharacterized protein n=1 Tax=Ridgeia piscesae TaxID=27915 RepID=A0AAD9P091_RIDPI|nr:hypothetical protein NP493_227g03073 [Ridgeia piscesae]